MPTFNAAKALDPLKFDMRPHYAGEGHVGEVPEPTDDQIAEFYVGLGKMLESSLGEERVAGYDLTAYEDISKLMMSLSVEDHRATYDEGVKLYAAVCSDQPNAEVLKALPYRLRTAFYGVVQEWLRPEAGRSATEK